MVQADKLHSHSHLLLFPREGHLYIGTFTDRTSARHPTGGTVAEANHKSHLFLLGLVPGARDWALVKDCRGTCREAPFSHLGIYLPCPGTIQASISRRPASPPLTSGISLIPRLHRPQDKAVTSTEQKLHGRVQSRALQMMTLRLRN